MTFIRQGKRATKLPIWKADEASVRRTTDLVAVEEPLELRLGYWDGSRYSEHAVAVTMRTPGDDVELCVGFLFAEGVIADFSEVERVRHDATRRVVTVRLSPDLPVDLTRLARYSLTTSSCGVCAKTSLEALDLAPNIAPLPVREACLDPEVVQGLPDQLLAEQETFGQTGGLHAAGFADMEGVLLDSREDIGRHNAVDKLVGARVMEGNLPEGDGILVVSGRASFELVQKALMARIPVLVAVGAPSSLAVGLADRYRMTLVGFTRHARFNVYSHMRRLRSSHVLQHEVA